MITERIIFENDEGKVSIVIPAPGNGLNLQEVAERAVPKGILYSIVDVSDIPTDREFRDAWKDTGSSIAHDIEKCKEIVKQRLRTERAPELAKLDVEVQRAQETGDTVKLAKVVAEKQKLRDAPASTRISGAQSVGELKGLNLFSVLAKESLR